MKDLTGLVFGQWSVLHYDRKIGTHNLWACRCGCGKVRSVYQCHLLSGKSTMCHRCSGLIHATNLIHGMARRSLDGKESREWRSWYSAKQRCYNLNDPEFHNVGGRGIRMCFWYRISFLNFFFDLGPCDSGLTIDRVDVNGHYSCGLCDECIANGWPANCRWATIEVQQNNRRNNFWIEYGGERKTAAQWGRVSGVPGNLIILRIKRMNWPAHAAIFSPVGFRLASSSTPNTT